MEIKITICRFKQWIKPFLFFTLTTFTFNTYACGGGCDEEDCNVYPYHVIYRTIYLPVYHRIHHIHHHKHHLKHHRWIKPVSCCGLYQEPCDCCYDPDMATGDDNQCRHPDMDIDY